MFQGLLRKQGGKHKGWRLRFFILSEQSLSYFDPSREKDTRVQPLGCILLSDIKGCEKLPYEKEKDKGKSIFGVHTKQGRTFILAADTDDSMHSWIGVISSALMGNKDISDPKQTKRTMAGPRIWADDGSIHTCGYTVFGCTETGSKQIIARHQPFCPYRVVQFFYDEHHRPLLDEVTKLKAAVAELQAGLER
eukprot:TRINITY_DN25456_c0_g1_i1.p1 TRINITY_DN25456_c0_g1~~TRINITY_DN25456_c0_g1_i1.p1  ORF type:complete len:193 (-),score=12.55 TRINITY_DN25456_c0_g1_i1:4-582(-)